ncbi:MAG: SapC family protein [Halofilum sp. (in: g-proteobacteria)]|nr:SapC family protein [Halofilum sp. (in: g-proteobacteria)]
MPESIEPLSAGRHGHLRLRQIADYRFTAGWTQVPLLFSELPAAAREFTIVFPSASPTRPVALLGQGDSGNRFVTARGHWRARYRPAYIRRYPFTLARPPGGDGGERQVVALDRSAPHLGEAEGEPLFGADGRPAQALARAVQFLARFQREVDELDDHFGPLIEQGVLVERTLDLSRGERIERRVAGIRVADRQRLLALDDAMLADWARSGRLEAVYAHLASLDNLRRFVPVTGG